MSSNGEVKARRSVDAASSFLAPHLPGIRASALLMLLFLVVYGGTNWFVTSRGEFSCIGLPWERSIPYLPWMLVPYLSLGVLFLVTPLLCRDDADRRLYCRRVALSMLVAAFFFLLMPLELDFPKRHASHWVLYALDLVDAIDPPHNLFPSLHVALAMLAGVHIGRRLNGWWRAAFVAWIVLVIASTVLTHRHHVLDALGGAALGLAALAIVRERRSAAPSAVPLLGRLADRLRSVEVAEVGVPGPVARSRTRDGTESVGRRRSTGAVTRRR
ncbi:MAG: hypothetical protein FJ253_01265 [Phycisphaerae bacterium]|nr:hypothetical protein [Phycisphaerae bacterium]